MKIFILNNNRRYSWIALLMVLLLSPLLSLGQTSPVEGKVSDILLINLLGNAPQEVAVGGCSVITVQMKPSANDLSEEVVVGYGSQ